MPSKVQATERVINRSSWYLFHRGHFKNVEPTMIYPFCTILSCSIRFDTEPKMYAIIYRIQCYTSFIHFHLQIVKYYIGRVHRVVALIDIIIICCFT